jgi:hypothetical protein
MLVRWTPGLPTAVIQRQASGVAGPAGSTDPPVGTVHEIVTRVDPGPMVMAYRIAKRHREAVGSNCRSEAGTLREVWQADHPQLDIWVLDLSGKPGRPWLTQHDVAVLGEPTSFVSLRSRTGGRCPAWPAPASRSGGRG